MLFEWQSIKTIIILIVIFFFFSFGAASTSVYLIVSLNMLLHWLQPPAVVVASFTRCLSSHTHIQPCPTVYYIRLLAQMLDFKRNSVTIGCTNKECDKRGHVFKEMSNYSKLLCSLFLQKSMVTTNERK